MKWAVKCTQCSPCEVSQPSASCVRCFPPLRVRLLKETSRSGECPLQQPCASCRSGGRHRRKDDPSVQNKCFIVLSIYRYFDLWFIVLKIVFSSIYFILFRLVLNFILLTLYNALDSAQQVNKVKRTNIFLDCGHRTNSTFIVMTRRQCARLPAFKRYVWQCIYRKLLGSRFYHAAWVL